MNRRHFYSSFIDLAFAMFNGFTKDTFKFFEELERNNNRNWFLENKTRYEDVVLAPALELVSDMQ